jgi:ADP-ribose pyrophosphatase YjhB (NUDIX family)
MQLPESRIHIDRVDLSLSRRLDWRYGVVDVEDRLIPEDLYAEVLHWMPICCVDTLITRGNRFLLTLRRHQPQAGHWWIQGGRLRKGESLEDAAKRTAKGETGLDVTLLACLGTFSTAFDSSAHANATTHTVNTTFLGSVSEANGDPQVDSAHDEYRWWPMDESTGNPYLDQLAELARKALKDLSDRR